MLLPRGRAASVVALACVAVLPATAAGATKHGITPLAPKAGAKVAEGRAVTFRMRVRGPGKVFVHVCKSAKRSRAEGTICSKVAIGQAKRRSGVFTYTQRFYDYPAYWLNTPGTYYWQAHRIACEKTDLSDCRQEGPVVKFRVG